MYDWLNLIWLSTVKQMFRFIMSSSNWDILSEKPRIVRTSDNHVHFNHQYASILPFDITWVTPRELKQFIQTKTFVHSNGHHWTLSIWFFPCSCGFQPQRFGLCPVYIYLYVIGVVSVHSFLYTSKNVSLQTYVKFIVKRQCFSDF